MVQKRPLGEEDLYEVSSKQPRHEPSCQLVSVLELSRESVAVDAYAPGGDEDNSSRTSPDANKKPDSHDVAEVNFSCEKETEMGIHGSASNSSWPTSSTSEEDSRPEAPFHILTSPEYYYFDHQFRAAAHHREIYSSLLSNPQKMVPVGPDFQAELPEWTPYSNKDKPCIEGIHETLSPSQADENELVGRTIIPMPKMELHADHVESIGERRVECSCEDLGSIRCVRLDIIEAREKLKLALGEETFVRLGFCDTGEVVAEKWSEEEEELFHEVVLSNPASLGKNFWNYLAIEFPSRRREELVSYYFNVFILRKRAEQNRFDPLNIDSDNDEWHDDIVDDADEGAKMTDEDEDSVVESPAYHNDLSYNMIHEEHDRRTYDEDVGEATWEDYKPVHFGGRKVFTDVQESCPGKLFDSNSGYKLSMQPQDQGLSNKVVGQEVLGGSCTTDAAGVTSESSLGKINNDKHWASDIAGMGSGTKHDSLLESCNGKEWDVGYLSCARNEVDLLPTQTMIEEVFGDGPWIYKSRDS